MSLGELCALVAFAQNFAGKQPGEPEQTGTSQEINRLLLPRPPIPDWLIGASPAFTIRRGVAGEQWAIGGLVETPPPVDSTNPDSLAYYLPFHFHADKWGIYVPRSSVLYLASQLKGAPLES